MYGSWKYRPWNVDLLLCVCLYSGNCISKTKIDRGGLPIKNAKRVFFIASADQKLNAGEKPHSGLRRT